MQYTNGNPGKAERNVSIGTDRAIGATYQELSAKYNLSQAHISRILNDADIKDVVETGSRIMVSYMPLALDKFYSILIDSDHSDHYKAIKDNLQATGILPSHTLNQTIVNIFNQTNNIVADPTVLKSIQRYASDDVIDLDLGLETDDNRSLEEQD